MSRNFKLFLGAGVLFYIAGSMNEAAALYVMAGVCLACILGCYVISRLGVAGLNLKVGIRSGTVLAGHDIPLSIRLSNIGLIPRPSVPVSIEVANLTVPVSQSPYLFPLPGLGPGQSMEVEAGIATIVRGEHTIAAPRLIASDPLGMFKRAGLPSEPIFFLCLPRPVHISREDTTNMLTERTKLQMASHRRRRGEFFGIRPHEPGDDLRDVHWKMAAHAGELVVKEYGGGRDFRAALWLDTRAENVIGSGPDSSFECQVVATASLVQALTDTNLEIELFGEGLPTSLRMPDRGRSTYHRYLSALARTKPSGQRAFGTNVGEWAMLVRPGATVFAITSGVEAALVAPLRAVAVRGIGLRVLICGAGNTDADIRRRQVGVLATLRAAGVPTVLAPSLAELPQAFSELAAVRRLHVAEGPSS